MKDIFVEKIMIECPMCGETHYVEKRQRISKAKIKDEYVEFNECYYKCLNDTELGGEFVPSKLMDENLLAARNAYRIAHQMMTSHDIVALRKKYGVTQKEFALMLGWGEITVARYETKLIQDETHDDVLKAVRDDALEARRYLERNKDSFTEERFNQILETIDREIDTTSVEYFALRKIEARYIRYQGDVNATGGIKIDTEKVRNMMNFFAQKCMSLFKVKLMKLLWYSDALYYQKHNVSMSGLVYQHMPMGALPIAHADLMELVSVEIIEDNNNQSISYKILPDKYFDEDVFTEEEKQVLYAVVNKFGNYTGKEIANYMHEETAYINTRENEVIPYSLAKLVRPLEN